MNNNNNEKLAPVPVLSSDRICDSKFWLLSFLDFFSRDFTILLITVERTSNKRQALERPNFHFPTKMPKICYGMDFRLGQFFEKNSGVVVVPAPKNTENCCTSTVGTVRPLTIQLLA